LIEVKRTALRRLFPSLILGMWALVPAARGTLVASGQEGPMLTLNGVLAVYIPLLVVLLWSQRRR